MNSVTLSTTVSKYAPKLVALFVLRATAPSIRSIIAVIAKKAAAIKKFWPNKK